MVIRSSFLKKLSGAELLKTINNFRPDIINKQPFSEKELLEFYMSYSDQLLTQARLMTEDNIFVLGNEARALFGHLADYRLDPTNRKNLSDAYGHFRRLNIDIFKIICDELDEFLFQYLEKHYHYDYRNINQSFLSKYTQMYFVAQNAYILAQVEEHTGSDRLTGNIIEKYFQAAKCYIELFVYLQNNRSGLEITKWKSVAKIVSGILVGILGIILSILTI